MAHESPKLGADLEPSEGFDEDEYNRQLVERRRRSINVTRSFELRGVFEAARAIEGFFRSARPCGRLCDREPRARFAESARRLARQADHQPTLIR